MLAIVVMLKNEASVIYETLLPYLTAGIKHFFIYDTGSTDDTLNITKNLLEEYAVIYHLKQETFIDFATSRNRALLLAEQAFSDTPFILMPDAEWVLQDVSHLLAFCAKEVNTEEPLYLIRIIVNGSLDFYVPRLFRTSAAIRFEGAVHEVPPTIATKTLPSNIHFQYNSSKEGIKKSKERWKRDLTLILNDYYEKPNHPRTLFYLAQTYECLDELHVAHHYYKMRAKLDGWIEESYITLFRLGYLSEKLSKIDTAFTWQLAEEYLKLAFALCPYRAEPLILLAEHYWSTNIPLCYVYIRQACEIPYPTHNALFIGKELYEYARFEILSRAAWYMGDYQGGFKATKKALAYHPNEPHLLHNLKLYKEKLENVVTS